MARTRRAKAREARQAALAVGLIALVVLVIGGLVAWRVNAGRAHVALRAIDDCPEAGPQAVTAILVDQTDPISPTTQADLRNELFQEAQAVPRYGALYLYAFKGSSAGGLTPIFYRCNPGSAGDVSELNSSKKRVQKRFNASFDAPIRASIDKMLTLTTASSSPIVESIQDVAVHAFGRGKSDAPRHIIIASDFMQNSSEVSFYQPDGAERLKTELESLSAPLEGVDVSLLMIQRPGRPGPSIEQLRDRWASYFRASGADKVRAVRLTGINP